MADHTKKIKVILVEDSEIQQQFLVQLLDADPSIRVIGVAANGLEAIELLSKIRPDVVLMDLHMPKMNGVETIRHIMQSNPLPIVAVSASNNIDTINSYYALEAGAVAFAEKPQGKQHPQHDFLRSYLIETIKLMSEIKMAHRTISTMDSTTNSPIKTKERGKHEIPFITKEIKLIAMGVSTGGPLLLKTLISLLPDHFAPIIIVQHIAPGFIDGMAKWLSQTTNRTVEIAAYGQIAERDHVYLAPDGQHIGVIEGGQIILQKNNAHYAMCPSIDYLFKSVADTMKGNSIGILLTGMGRDGVVGLKKMREQGAVTIAQDEKSSLVYGMPQQAVLSGAAQYVLTPEEIARTISFAIL